MVAELDWSYIKIRPQKAVVRLFSHIFFQGRYVTTRHRWFNLFILAGLDAIKRFPIFRQIEKPIFIIGTGRSGSTILGKVLSLHREIGFLNEPKAIWFVVDPRDDVNGHFQLKDGQYRFTEDDATLRKQIYVRRIFGLYSALTGSERVLDKNPEILYRVPYVRKIFPDAKFIFLVRNGRDTVGSIIAWSKGERVKKDGWIADWWGVNRRKWQLMVEQLVPDEPLLAGSQEEIHTFTREEDMAAVEWVLAMQEGQRCAQKWPESVCTVHYENLNRDPRAVLSSLVSFCELCQDETFLSYAETHLKPNRPKPAVNLASSIEGAFTRTMSELNYQD